MVTREKQQEMAAAIEEVLSLHDVKIDAMTRQMAGEEGDFSGILAQCQERLDTLKANADNMLKNIGMTREQLEEYVSNKANFSKEEWDMLEKTKKTCEEIKERDANLLKSHIPAEILHKKPEPVKKKKKKMMKKKDWVQL